MNLQNRSLLDRRKKTLGENGLVNSMQKVKVLHPLPTSALPKRRLGVDAIVNLKRKLVESGVLQTFQAWSVVLSQSRG